MNKIFEIEIVNLFLPISFNICFGCSKDKVGRSKPGAVLTGYNRPCKYSRSRQYRSIGGRLSFLVVI